MDSGGATDGSAASVTHPGACGRAGGRAGLEWLGSAVSTAAWPGLSSLAYRHPSSLQASKGQANDRVAFMRAGAAVRIATGIVVLAAVVLAGCTGTAKPSVSGNRPGLSGQPAPVPTTPGGRIAAVLLSPAQLGMPTTGIRVMSEDSGKTTTPSMPLRLKAGQSCAMILLSARFVGSTAHASTTMTNRGTTFVEGVATYPPGGAAKLLAALPVALRRCGPRTPRGFSHAPQAMKVATTAGPSLGDGSLLIHDSITTRGQPVMCSTILVSRYSDRIVWLEITGHSAAANDHYNLTALTDKIAASLH